MSKTYNGNYVGIVIQNNDPIGQGRVKVYVPHISPNVYKRWNEISKDKKFKFLGKNINSDLSTILEDLKEIIPWCTCASPLVGENTSGKYNSKFQYGTTSDSNLTALSGIFGSKTAPVVQTTDGTGEKEASIYEKYKTKLSDPFNDPIGNKVNQVNMYSNEYTPTVYSNGAKGSFSIPAVGSHLWVFFYEGDPHYPVYWASSFGQPDWQSIYNFTDTGLDYPGSFENTPLSASSQDSDDYRNKFIINQKGGTIIINNSDHREQVKISHYSGSFKNFTNDTTVELAVHNDQKMVLEDQFHTVKGNRNEWVGRDLDYTCRGDYYLKIGNLNDTVVKQWKEIVGGIANIKQLFDIKRAETIQSQYLKYTSTIQSRSGNFAKCPVCLGAEGREFISLNNTSTIQQSTPVVSVEFDEVLSYFTVNQPLIGPTASKRSYPPVSRCPVCGGSGISPSSMDGTWVTETLKDYNNLKSLYNTQILNLAKFEEQMGIGGNHIIDITKHKVETIGLVMNDFGSIRVDLVGKIDNSAVLVDVNGVYISKQESPVVEYVHVDDLPGGNYTLNVCSKYNLQVGAGGMNMKSYGPVNISGTVTNIGGTQVNVSSELETNIYADKRLTITSDLVILKNKSGGQVLVDSNLGVAGNAIIRGGTHIEGELTVNHITAPVEIQTTELTSVLGKLLSGLQFSCLINGEEATVVLTSDSNDDLVQMYGHSHHFKNIPLKLVGGNDDLRRVAQSNNGSELTLPGSIANVIK